MNHKKLCIKGENWLKGQGYPLSFAEIKSWGCKEQPDAIGWDFRGRSCLLEIKTSRSDFFADQKKPFRKKNKGCGRLRYYVTPKGLVKPEELPEGWGLLEVSGRGLRIKKKSDIFTPDSKSEVVLLVTASRFRLEKSKLLARL